MTATLEIDGFYVPVACPIATVGVITTLSEDRLTANIIFVQRTPDEQSGIASLQRAKRDLKVQPRVVSGAPDLVRFQSAPQGYSVVVLERKTPIDVWTTETAEAIPTQTSPAIAPLAQMSSMSLQKVLDAIQ
jgi:hypothetical protein